MPGTPLSDDGHAHKAFDYMLSNPPFGVEWKKVDTAVRKEHEREGYNGRFGPGLPRVSDGSLLFLLHLISKMRPAVDGGNRTRNVAVLVEDVPPGRTPSSHPKKLLLGLFHGIPMTKKSVFNLPDYVVLYQKDIEAVCSSEAEVRAQIRLTAIHEFGHYFGMDEEQLKDV